MTTITLESLNSAQTGRLEELVDRLLATLFRADTEHSAPTLARAIHLARRLRQSGDLGGALAAFSGLDTASASDSELRWLYAEWVDVAQRRFVDANTLLYSPDTGRAAVLVPASNEGNATLEAAAVLGMRWPVGKPVSRRSLRGLKPLHNRNDKNNNNGGSSW